MKLVVDANIPAAERCFGHFGKLIRVPGREINAAHLQDADALIVRSITQVNDQLLADSPVRFVGTCTIGTDHIDQAALAQRDIAFASAPGCNAEAVVDYVLSGLLTLAERDGWVLSERTVGIVGAGNVGSRLQARLTAMGVATLACDPPKAAVERAEEEPEQGFHSLGALIERCDVLCLHTPLTREGPHATYQLLNAQRIDELAPGSVVLNAGRGDCVDGLALRSRLAGKGDISAILDVWEEEPDIDAGLRDLVSLATPHIAGHSLDGKIGGAVMVADALLAHCQLKSDYDKNLVLPRADWPALDAAQLLSISSLSRWVNQHYDIMSDDARFRRYGMTPEGFDSMRKKYRKESPRREFINQVVACHNSEQYIQFLKLGFDAQQTDR